MSETSFAKKRKGILDILKKALYHIFLHNGRVKLLAVIISLLLWTGLISQDDTLTREKTWQNVNVNITGTETLNRNALIVVSDLSEILGNVSVTAAVPQKQYDQAEASAYNLRIDLSKISQTGLQEVKILCSSSSLYGKVINTVPSTVMVDVEEYAIRQRVPVSVSVTGDAYQNGWYGEWYISNLSVDPALIAVSGPRSLVQPLSRARVFIDPETLEWTEGTILTTGEIKLYNRSGEEISSKLLGISTESIPIDTVLIEANILPTKRFNITDLIEYQGKVKDGYKIVSTKVSPEYISIAAHGEVLEQMEELPMERIIKVQDLSETTVMQLKVQKPSEDAVLSNETVTVTVEIAEDHP